MEKRVQCKKSHNNFLEKNCRGQGLSTNAIILIVLGVVVLVVLAVGFTMGWKQLAPWLPSGGSNIDIIKQQCSTACITNSANDFCLASRELNINNIKYSGVTCYQLSLDVDFKKFGVESCSAVNCKNIVTCDNLKSYSKNGEQKNDANLESDKEFEIGTH